MDIIGSLSEVYFGTCATGTIVEAFLAGTSITPLGVAIGLGSMFVTMHGLDGLFAATRKAITGSDQRAYTSQLMDSFTGDAATADLINSTISSLATAGTASMAKALGKVDELGRCASTLAKMVFGNCFTGDTLVHVTALARGRSTDRQDRSRQRPRRRELHHCRW